MPPLIADHPLRPRRAARAWPRRGAAGPLLTAAFAAALALSASAHAGGVDVLVQDDAGRPLAGAVVFVASPAAQATLAAQKGARVAVVAQQGRQFVPSVVVVPVGTAVSFPNHDTVRHHIYSFSPVKRFEIKLYAGTPANPVLFDQPGIATLGCNIHDGMAAWVVVVDSAWHGLTQADGRLSLPAVAAGPHVLQVWHASLPPGSPPQELALNVPGSGPAQASVRLAGARP